MTRQYIRIITWQGEKIQDIAEIEHEGLDHLFRKDGACKMLLSSRLRDAIELGTQVTIEKGEYK